MIYFRLFLSFTKIAFFSFGGLTMIPVINDEVLRYGWMTESEVMDIVAIAEMTPGSLGINCATFVGLKTAGVLGALSASLGAMMPSFTICMAVTYFIMKLKGSNFLESIMAEIRPICIGMIFAVAITLGKTTFIPVGTTIKWNLVLIAAVIFIAVIKFKISIPKTILLAALMGLLIG